MRRCAVALLSNYFAGLPPRDCLAESSSHLSNRCACWFSCDFLGNPFLVWESILFGAVVRCNIQRSAVGRIVPLSNMSGGGQATGPKGTAREAGTWAMWFPGSHADYRWMSGLQAPHRLRAVNVISGRGGPRVFRRCSSSVGGFLLRIHTKPHCFPSGREALKQPPYRFAHRDDE